MSGPFKADGGDVQQLARFLRLLNKATADTGWVLVGYPMEAQLLNDGDPASSLAVEHDGEQYVINDRTGS